MFINTGEVKNKMPASNHYTEAEKKQAESNVAQNKSTDTFRKGTDLTISAEGLERLKQGVNTNSFMEMERIQSNGVSLLESYLSQLESSDEEKEDEDIGKLIEIARRIARGDKVPQKDEKKLIEYNAGLYQMAKMSAMLRKNKKPKEHKSLYEEDKNDINSKLRDLMRADSSEKGGQAAISQSVQPSVENSVPTAEGNG